MKCIFVFLILIFATKVTPGNSDYFSFISSQLCSLPPIPTNGGISFVGGRGILRASVVRYRCDEGYTLHGSTFNSCNNNRWTQTVPVCRRTDPCLKRSVCPYKATCYRTGETSYACVCSRGYTGVSRPGQPVHKCLRNCRNPGSHYQATLIGRKFDGYTEGDKITWRCNFGFTEKSRAIITQICSTYGFWFGSRPTCYRSNLCLRPRAPKNGFVNPSRSNWISGDVARFGCNAGFRIVGRSSEVCESETSFQNPPTCEDQDECVNGSHSCHANATCTNTEGSFACSCKDGFIGDGYNCTDADNSGSDDGGESYTIIATATITSSTTYSSATQKEDECHDGSHSCHVNAACTNIGGSFACTCNDGYVGNGYKCRATCQPPARPEGGTVDAFARDVFVEGDEVQYRCSVGFELVGNERATCRNHTFGIPPLCRPRGTESTGTPIP